VDNNSETLHQGTHPRTRTVVTAHAYDDFDTYPVGHTRANDDQYDISQSTGSAQSSDSDEGHMSEQLDQITREINLLKTGYHGWIAHHYEPPPVSQATRTAAELWSKCIAENPQKFERQKPTTDEVKPHMHYLCGCHEALFEADAASIDEQVQTTLILDLYDTPEELCD